MRDLILKVIFVIMIVGSLTALFPIVLRLTLAYAFAYPAYVTILALLAKKASKEAMKWLDDAERVMRG